MINLEHLYRYCARIRFLSYPFQVMRPLFANSILEAYTSWSGIQGGYSFYSPAVGNSYEIQFRQQLAKDYDTTPETLLHTATGVMRYHSLLDIGISFVCTDRTDEQQAAITIVKQARHIYRSYYPDASVCVTLASYVCPSLSQLESNRQLQPFYLSLYTYHDTIVLSNE